MQHAACIAEPADTLLREAVCIDACNLRSDVCANAHIAPTELIKHAEREHIDISPEANKQGFSELYQRWNHVLVSPGLIGIEQCAAQLLNPGRLKRQHFLNPVR